MVTMAKEMTTEQKINSLMEFFGITKAEAIIELKDAGEYEQ